MSNKAISYRIKLHVDFLRTGPDSAGHCGGDEDAASNVRTTNFWRRDEVFEDGSKGLDERVVTEAKARDVGPSQEPRVATHADRVAVIDRSPVRRSTMKREPHSRGGKEHPRREVEPSP